MAYPDNPEVAFSYSFQIYGARYYLYGKKKNNGIDIFFTFQRYFYRYESDMINKRAKMDK
jgi:hypothetical protein